MTTVEQIALLLWERFAPEHDADADNAQGGEYYLAAHDIMKIINTGYE